MTIRELTPSLINDWFDFFENRAFEDHREWEGCYCTAFYYPKPEDYPAQSNRRKDFALWLVESGRLCGYMAYEEGRVIGWVSANRRGQFPRLAQMPSEKENILAIVCFIVEKAHRGKGVAKSLLNMVMENAKQRGFQVLEAYPKKGARSEYGRWNGPYELYKSAGFLDHQSGSTKVVRKYL